MNSRLKCRWRWLRLLVAGCAAGLALSNAAAETTLPWSAKPGLRHFADGEGRPVFWLGDTEWELFHSLTADDARALLTVRRDQGFNVIQVMITGVFPEWNASHGLGPNGRMEAWLNGDPLHPNEAYFKEADAIIAAADELGLVLVIGVYHARDVEAGRITFENARAWARWVAQRYRDRPNIIWSMYPHAESASVAIIREVAAGLRDGDTGAHAITMLPDPSPASSSFLHAEPWLSFNTLQSWSTGFENYELTAADYAKTPVKIVVNGEARYEEEDGTTALDCRRAGYWACLAGGFYSYGHRDNWKSPGSWREWVESPGARQMKVLGHFFRAILWWKLVPDQTLWSEPPARGNVAARSVDRDWMLAYLVHTDPVALDLTQIRGSDRASATWIDPRDGKRSPAGEFSTRRAHTFTPPAIWEDALLWIERADAAR